MVFHDTPIILLIYMHAQTTVQICTHFNAQKTMLVVFRLSDVIY